MFHRISGQHKGYAIDAYHRLYQPESAPQTVRMTRTQPYTQQKGYQYGGRYRKLVTQNSTQNSAVENFIRYAAQS